MSKSYLRKVSASGRHKNAKIVAGHHRLSRAARNALKRANYLP